MPNPTDLTPEDRDRALALYTDQVLSAGEIHASEDDDLKTLQSTVERMSRAFGPSEPEPAVAARIKRNLMAEWEVQHPVPGVRASLMDRLAEMIRPLMSQPALGLGMAVLAAIIIGAILFTFPSGGGLVGSASGGADVPPWLAVVAVVFLGGALWWMLRRKE
jgi:hypothetical protein